MFLAHSWIIRLLVLLFNNPKTEEFSDFRQLVAFDRDGIIGYSTFGLANIYVSRTLKILVLYVSVWGLSILCNIMDLGTCNRGREDLVYSTETTSIIFFGRLNILKFIWPPKKKNKKNSSVEIEFKNALNCLISWNRICKSRVINRLE